MSANALVQTRIDITVKEEAAHVLAAMGLTVSDAVRLLLTRIATEKQLTLRPWCLTRQRLLPLKNRASAKSPKQTP